MKYCFNSSVRVEFEIVEILTDLEFTIFAYSMLGMFAAMVLFVVFGQVTVRKLRKNPATKDNLGMEFTSGWDILNVAGALSCPLWLNNKLRSTPLSFLYADAKLLYQYTNKFDRLLALVFYTLFMLSGTALIVLVLLDWIGVFE